MMRPFVKYFSIVFYKFPDMNGYLLPESMK